MLLFAHTLFGINLFCNQQLTFHSWWSFHSRCKMYIFNQHIFNQVNSKQFDSTAHPSMHSSAVKMETYKKEALRLEIIEIPIYVQAPQKSDVNSVSLSCQCEIYQQPSQQTLQIQISINLHQVHNHIRQKVINKTLTSFFQHHWLQRLFITKSPNKISNMKDKD